MAMFSTSKTPSVPTTGWYGFSDGEWHHDPDLTVTPGIKPPCQSIIVMFCGRAQAQTQAAKAGYGVYVPTSQWCRGCPVYKHTHRQLFISRRSGWTITSDPASGPLYLENKARGLCPARGSRGYWQVERSEPTCVFCVLPSRLI